MGRNTGQSKDNSSEPAGCGLKRFGFFWPGRYFRKACKRHDSLQEVIDAGMGLADCIDTSPKKADKEFLRLALKESGDSWVLKMHAYTGYGLLRLYSLLKYRTFK